jgi:DNA-binding NtrC family response regulator
MPQPAVIVLEDEPLCLQVFQSTLELAGYECAAAATEGDTFVQLERLGGAVQALIVDLFLPGCWGTDVALKVVALHPGLGFLFVSGTSLSAWPAAEWRKLSRLPPGSFGFLQKPFRPHALLEKLEPLLRRYALRQNA